MESDKEYQARKHAELEYISERLELDLAEPIDIPKNNYEVYQTKMKLRSIALSKFSQEYSFLGETNLFKDKPIQLGDYHIKYTYQRFDLTIEGPNPYSFLQVVSQKNPKYISTYFVNSGMSAIMIFALTLARIKKISWKLFGLSDVYFEAQHLFNENFGNIDTAWVNSRKELIYKIKEVNNNNANIIWIDSMNQNSLIPFLNLLEEGDVELICVDTSCLRSDSSEIETVTHTAEKLKVPIVFLRSHHKLDYLGLEYSRLGSLVVYTPKVSSPIVLQFSEILNKILLEQARLSGSFCNLFSLTFKLDAIGNGLNKKRIQICKNNNKLIYNLLSGSSLNIKKYNHELFVTIHDLSLSAEKANIILNNFLERCQEIGVFVFNGGSFGLEITTMFFYETIFEKSGTIRIASSDNPEWITRKFIQLMLQENIIQQLK